MATRPIVRFTVTVEYEIGHERREEERAWTTDEDSARRAAADFISRDGMTAVRITKTQAAVHDITREIL